MNRTMGGQFFRLISLLSEIKMVQSSDRIQKMVFILKNEGVPFDEKYTYYHIGPYSSDLQLEIRDLIEQNILETDKETPQTIKLKLISDIEGDPEISTKRGLINFLSDLDKNDLEIVSTIYYLKDLGYTNEDQIKFKIQALKPDLRERIESGFKNYERIKENHFVEC